jgi:hypothetical protein
MWIELIKAVAELVTPLAWPIAVVIVCLKFKAVLLDAAPSLFRRKVEFEGFGVKAKIEAAEQQQATAENPATEKLLRTPALDPSPRPAVNIVEKALRDELKDIETEKREPHLVRSLALTRLERGHEFTYNRIFGSQIAWLKRLNEVGRATVDDARGFFRPYAEQFPQIYTNYGFDGWLNFLKASALIAQHDNVLEISEFGRDFLMYLTERRLSEIKPG